MDGEAETAGKAGHRREFSRIAGHRALDFVNTVEWRLSPSRFEEDLNEYADVLRWSTQLDLIGERDADDLRRAAEASVAPSSGPGTGADPGAETARVRRLREAIYRVLYAAADPEPIIAEYREALDRGRLEWVGGRWSWQFPIDLALPRRRIALEAFDLLSRDDLAQLAQCQDADCGWVFLDTSPRHNRRWCVSADCGNRNRVREFYERTKSTT
ncbi:CGNR zinc finger domain-containing protein [Microbacterium sp. P01]|uniref:CGNR zinc finger domain-containing protein n=1 Tax=unclassified Microbacterium TaxID=2609290 RepID=UPI0036708303